MSEADTIFLNENLARGSQACCLSLRKLRHILIESQFDEEGGFNTSKKSYHPCEVVGSTDGDGALFANICICKFHQEQQLQLAGTVF